MSDWDDGYAKGRADERATAATRMYLQREHLRVDLRARVEALRDDWARKDSAQSDGALFALVDVLALLDEVP